MNPIIPTTPIHSRLALMLVAVLSSSVLVLAGLGAFNQRVQLNQEFHQGFEHLRASLQWGVWHELVTNCCFVSNKKLGARLLNQWRPIGMTRIQCIKQFGHPQTIFPENGSVAVATRGQKESWCYDIEGNRLQIELNFCGEKCVSCAYMVVPCTHCRSDKGRELLIESIDKDFQSKSHAHFTR